MNLKIEIPGRDWVETELSVVNGVIESVQIKGVGCADFLMGLDELRGTLKGKISDLTAPPGNSHTDMIFRELVLKIKGEWELPYKEEELCHCRMVPLSVVDAAIVTGADTIEDVCRRTNAGTGCGTCRPHSEDIIKYRKA